MYNFPNTSVSELKNCSDMEALALFYQHSMEMIEWFKEHQQKIEIAKSESGKWNPVEIVSHILFWDHLFLEERIIPTANGINKLKSIDDTEVNPKSIMIASKGFNHLIKDLERSRSQISNYLGELDTKQWESYSFHPTWKRVDLFRLIEELIRHDCHHGKVILSSINK